MKKLISILLVLTLALSLFIMSSCNKKDKDDVPNEGANNSEVENNTNPPSKDDNINNSDDKENSEENDNNVNENEGNKEDDYIPSKPDDDMSIIDTADKLMGMSPEELYDFTQRKMAESKYFTSLSTQEITMVIDGEPFTFYQYAANIINEENYYILTANEIAPEAAIEAWYLDGTVYAIKDNSKFKTKITREEFMQKYMGKDPAESSILDIPESWFKDAKFEFDGEYWLLRFVIDGDKYTEYFGNILGGTLESAVVTDDVKYNIYFDSEGNIQQITNSVDLIINGYQTHLETVTEVTLEYIEIEAPKDPDSFVEVEI